MAMQQVRDMAARAVDRLTTDDDPVLAAEPASPHHVAPLPAPSDARGSSFPTKQSLVLGAILLVGLAGSLVVVATSPYYILAPAVSWRFNLPGLLPGTGGSSVYFGSMFLIGVISIALGWLLMIGYVRRSSSSEKRKVVAVIVALACWSVPFLAGPIQISTDAYSYAAQGFMASIGLDPSAQGPDAIPLHSSNDFWMASDPIWRHSPAPYGPVAVATNEAAVVISGGDVTRSVFLIRLAAVAGVVMAGIGVYLIAVRRQVSPSIALLIGVANPLVLIHFIGGAHNDALMAGLLCLGLAAWERSRRWLAIALVIAAVMVKLPAILALGLIAWNWSGADAGWRQRVRDIPIVGAVFAALVGLACLLVGIGLGWITALSSTGSVYSTFSPSTKIGFILSDLLDGTGIDVDAIKVVGVTRALGLLVGGAIIAAVLVRSPRIGVTRATGISLIVLTLASPVIWPWYLPVGFALVAASGVRRLQPSLVVLIVASALTVWPTSVDAVVPLSRYQHWLGLLVVATITAGCFGAQYVAGVTERRRLEGRGRVPRLEAVLIGPSATPPVAAASVSTVAAPATSSSVSASGGPSTVSTSSPSSRAEDTDEPTEAVG